jgi:hypothetical protein
LLRFFGIRTHRGFRLRLRGTALLIGLIATFIFSVALQLMDFDAALYAFLVVLFAAFLEFLIADDLADHSFPFDTERKLELMEKRIGAQAISMISKRLTENIREFKGCDTSKVSATVHILTEISPESLQKTTSFGLLQLTDYVGPEGGRKGRITHVTKGIIGRCARTENMETVDFADADEYHSSMVKDFGFTNEETERHTKTGRSYLAYPIKNKGRIVGVLYFFSSQPQVLPHATNQTALDRLAKEVLNLIELSGIV